MGKDRKLGNNFGVDFGEQAVVGASGQADLELLADQSLDSQAKSEILLPKYLDSR